MKKTHLMPSAVLTAICLAAALLLSVINLFTAPVIKERENEKAAAALSEVLPGGSDFKALDITEAYPKNISEAYSADGGFVFRAVGNGRNGDIIVMVGISSDGKIAGTKVITTSETPKYADPVYSAVAGEGGKYNGQTSETFAPVIIAGSTMTSDGFANAIKAALNAYIVANGGSVDNRTPEEILQDNCNTALGTSKLKFTKWFACEAVIGVDSVYEAEENGGRVYLIGDSFVGVKDGVVTTADATEENKAAALLADSVISESSLEEIAKPEGINRAITKIYKTASGNYVFEAKATGFSAQYSGPEIIIKISVSAEGKIIDCLTESHAESKGYGDKCATEEYYSSWRGISADEVVISASPITPGVTDPGAISGATYTANGYQKTVKAIFAAFNLLTEGGNN